MTPNRMWVLAAAVWCLAAALACASPDPEPRTDLEALAKDKEARWKAQVGEAREYAAYYCTRAFPEAEHEKCIAYYSPFIVETGAWYVIKAATDDCERRKSLEASLEMRPCVEEVLEKHARSQAADEAFEQECRRHGWGWGFYGQTPCVRVHVE